MEARPDGVPAQEEDKEVIAAGSLGREQGFQPKTFIRNTNANAEAPEWRGEHATGRDLQRECWERPRAQLIVVGAKAAGRGQGEAGAAHPPGTGQQVGGAACPSGKR